MTPLIQAAQNGDCEIAELLLEFGADPYAIDNETPEWSAVIRAKTLDMKALLSRFGVDPVGFSYGINPESLLITKARPCKLTRDG